MCPPQNYRHSPRKMVCDLTTLPTDESYCVCRELYYSMAARYQGSYSTIIVIKVFSFFQLQIINFLRSYAHPQMRTQVMSITVSFFRYIYIYKSVSRLASWRFLEILVHTQLHFNIPNQALFLQLYYTGMELCIEHSLV